MRRFFSTLFFCACLLIGLSWFLFPRAAAKDDPIAVLLRMPAPPPPNPLSGVVRERFPGNSAAFAAKPPADDAPIEDLVGYWSQYQYRSTANGSFPNSPTPKTVERLLGEVQRDPSLLPKLLTVIPDDPQTTGFVKERYDQLLTGNGDRSERSALKEWLTTHGSYFSDELALTVEKTKDTNNYVDLKSENNLLALTKNDFEKAEPIIRRLYTDRSNPVSQALATWALYKHALDSNSTSDVERYRAELMRMVEDRTLPDGVRDKANDGLTHEKHFPGLEEWTIGLFEDESLVNMDRYTMLTTMAMFSTDKDLGDRLLKLVRSSSKPVVRSAAIRNLMLLLSKDPQAEFKQDAVRTMLPWLDDPKWATDLAESRSSLVRFLGQMEVPESVPGLIKILDEKSTRNVTVPAPAANSAAPVANRPAANANVKGLISPDDLYEGELYPYRTEAISALGMQKDPRAVPHLKRVLSEVEGYQQLMVVSALLECKGFTVTEQVEGLELVAKNVRQQLDNPYVGNSVNTVANAYGYGTNRVDQKHTLSPAEIKSLVGMNLLTRSEISDELARAVVDRIEELDKSNKPLAEAFRMMTLRWQNAVVSLLYLSDLKRGQAEAEAIVRLLARRKDLKEKHISDVMDVRTGTQSALGISTCLLDDASDAASMIEKGSTEAKTALLACSRLIRMPLPVDKVAALLSSPTPLLASAAERYLESEDSPNARNIVLSRHPGESLILGARGAFYVGDEGLSSSGGLQELFTSVGIAGYVWAGSEDLLIKKAEKAAQDEIKTSPDLLGIYSYERNTIRIYKDKAVYSVQGDDSRYWERTLEKHEFEEIRRYVSDNKLDDVPPFLNCGGYCPPKELLMVGKNGGRRLYIRGESKGIAEGLDKIFADLQKTPGTLRYTLSRDLPGLEIIIAADELHGETVWKDGTELRLAASLPAVREKVDAELEAISDEESDAEDASEEEAPSDVYKKRQSAWKKRAYEGFGWYRINANGAGPGAPQPNGVEFIPLRDGLEPAAEITQWKTRGPGFEIRASEDGLFKVVRGHASKVKAGFYSNAMVTPNGRWVVATKTDPEEGSSSLVRVDLTTNKEIPVEIEDGNLGAVAFVPTLNKFLLMGSNRYYGDYSEERSDDAAPGDPDADELMLLDPATGGVQPASGEFRPLTQQTFRPLQPTSRPNEFWAAMFDPEKAFTQVGRYSTKTFTFTPVLKVPRIKFNSMSMYVDEPANKVYFVYRGDLLALPLGSKPVPEPLPSPK